MAGFPKIEAKEGAPEGMVAFDATFEVYPEVKVGDLSGAEIEKTVAEVSDAEIDKTIDILRKQRVHYHVKGEQGEHGDGGAEQTAQNGDRVTIDFIGKIDDVEFPGGKAEDYAFVLGEGRMLPEFEAATVGLKVGESKTFDLHFPEDYHGKDVAGKTAQFTITLKKLEWAHMPEVDAEFAKSLGIEDGDMGKMREDIKRQPRARSAEPREGQDQGQRDGCADQAGRAGRAASAGRAGSRAPDGHDPPGHAAARHGHEGHAFPARAVHRAGRAPRAPGTDPGRPGQGTEPAGNARAGEGAGRRIRARATKTRRKS